MLMYYGNLCRWIVGRKLFFIAVAFLVHSLTTIGQTTVAVAPTKLNVLYIGVDNPVSVATSAGSDDKVTVSISGGNGMISKTGLGLYNVRVGAVTDECLLQVYVEGKLTGTTSFRVRALPYPSAAIGMFPSGSRIASDVFKAQIGVGLGVKDFPFDTKYEVISYSVNMDDGKGNVKTADCRGAAFSAQARQYIDEYVKAGKIVTIENIRAKNAEGKELKLPALLYNIN